uniref:Uncharacterized protein n=1 Tax=Wuchereria bancrofti TaxID=6293 RepID=A0AAF5RTV8_WUCBA
MFADQHGKGMKFVVLEKAAVPVFLCNTISKASADMSVKEAMVKMFSAAVNMEKIRPPQTCCPFRGTPTWTRSDDLIAWLYVMCQLFANEREPIQPLPWMYRNNTRVRIFLLQQS